MDYSVRHRFPTFTSSDSAPCQRVRSSLRPSRLATFALAAVLAACTDPASQCRLDATRDLRVLDRQIAQAEEDIRYGYRLEVVESPFRIGMTLCLGARDSVFCDDDGPSYRRVPINIPAERARPASLRQQRAAEAPRAQAALARCPAT